MSKPHLASELCAPVGALAPPHVKPSTEGLPDGARAATDIVDLELRAAWQECLGATNRYAQLARAVLDEMGARGLGRRRRTG